MVLPFKDALLISSFSLEIQHVAKSIDHKRRHCPFSYFCHAFGLGAFLNCKDVFWNEADVVTVDEIFVHHMFQMCCNCMAQQSLCTVHQELHADVKMLETTMISVAQGGP